METLEILQSRIPRVTPGVSLAQYTTFGIGGPAEYFFETESDEDLRAALRAARELSLPLTLIAGGSNIVASNSGVAGLVVRIAHGEIRELHEFVLEADAGVLLGDLIEAARRYGYAGLESLVGIPGTVGGAVFGNAGAYGRSVSEAIDTIRIFDGMDEREISKKAGEFAYRTSIFKSEPWFILSVRFCFSPGDPEALRERSEAVLAARLRNYKPDMRCPGSFFKNVLVRDLSLEVLDRIDQSKVIEGKVPAGYLLDAVGAKGTVLGGLAVAQHHGNLILNTGDAKSDEVKALAALLKQRVWERFGIALEEEIRYIGS